MARAVKEALEFGIYTDPGMVRSNNEDSVTTEPAIGLAILADGMGGSNAGEVASGMATALLANDLREALAGNVRPNDHVGGEPRAFRLLRDRISVANTSIFNAAQHQPQYAGMGTTVVVALFYDNRLAVAHIGDSRLYRLRGGELTQLTRDHSFLQLQLDSGLITPEEAKTSKQKNVVTRALGVDPTVEAEVHEHRAQPGDIYVLCSDGLHDMVPEKDLVNILSVPRQKLQVAAKQLVQVANDNGGKDNVSVVLVKVLGDYAAPKGRWRRLFRG